MMLGSTPTARPATTTTRASPRGPAASSFVGYPAGAMAYFQYIDEWRNTGDFEGLEFR